jgi:hypothetical protein
MILHEKGINQHAGPPHHARRLVVVAILLDTDNHLALR